MKLSVRYLTTRPGAAGGMARYFWQPSAALAALGFEMQRVPLNWRAIADPEQLRAAAIARAEELNAEVDSIRAVGSPTEKAPPPRTVGAMLHAYEADRMFTRLAPATQRGYRQCFQRIRAWGDDTPVRFVGPKQVQEMIAGLSATPAFANACARTLQAAFKFGRLNGWVTVSPAEKMGLIASEPSGLIWPPHVVAAFVAAADAMGLPGMGDAVLLNEWLGQRQGDVLRMPRTVYRAGNLVLRQGKGSVAVSLPIDMVPHLVARLELALLRSEALHPMPSTIIVSDNTRLPFKADNFRHTFARVRTTLATGSNEYAIAPLPQFDVDYLPPGRDMTDIGAFTIATEDLTFMHLRHTAVVRLAEAGNDLPAISAVTGHTLASIPGILKRYMVRTRTLAAGAFAKRMTAEGIQAAGEQGGKEKQA